MPMSRQRGGRAGFTLLELIVVMMIAAVLISIAVPQFRQYLERRSVINARDTFGMMAARARAASIERGENVWLTIDPDAGVVRVDTVAGAAPLDMMDLSDGDIRAMMDGTTVTTVVFTPRGFADPGSSTGLPKDVQFTNGSASATVTITPIGRVQRQ